MSVTTTPLIASSVLSARSSLSFGGTKREVLDLINMYGADLWVLIARQGTSAFTGFPPVVVIRPTYSTDAIRVPGDVYGRSTNNSAANKPTLSSGGGAGSTAIVVNSATGFAVDQIIAIESGTSSVEWARISKISGTTLTLDAPLIATHSNGVDVTNYAEVIYVPLPGNKQYEIIVDYGNATAGPDLDVKMLVNKYTGDITA